MKLLSPPEVMDTPVAHTITLTLTSQGRPTSTNGVDRRVVSPRMAEPPGSFNCLARVALPCTSSFPRNCARCKVLGTRHTDTNNLNVPYSGVEHPSAMLLVWVPGRVYVWLRQSGSMRAAWD